MISRMSSMPVWEAASISITSTWRPSMIAWQCSPSTGMSIVGPVDRAVRQLVVERAREDARGRGLADAAHAGEHPGLRDAAGRERVGERAHHRLLADQVGEGRRPVLARQHAVGARPCGVAEIEARSDGSGRIGVVHRGSSDRRWRRRRHDETR